MHILHIIPQFPYISKTVIGGAANSLFNLAKSQSKDNEVSIASFFPSYIPEQRKGNDNIAFIPIVMRSRPNSFQYGLEFILRSLLLSRKLEGKYDLLHGHSGHIDYILPLVTLAKYLKLPLIYSLNCPVYINSNVTKFPGRKRLITTFYKKADKFIAISNNVLRSMEIAGIPEGKIEVIPPAIDILKYGYAKDQRPYRKKLNLIENGPIFLFVGSIAPTKNLETVILAFRKVVNRMPGALLITTTELKLDRYRQRGAYLSKLIEETQLSNNILQLGIIDNMQEFMASADMLLAPFRSTDGPSDYFLAALEAMSVGRPVIVSPIGAMKEVVDDEVGVFVSPEDSEQLSGAMLALVSDPKQSERMGVAASARVREKFNPEASSKAFQAIYWETIRNATR